MNEKTAVLAGATMLTPDGLRRGHVAVEGGIIKAVGNGTVPPGSEDLDGDFLFPGLVELHTDNLEKQLRPRPGLYWPEPGAAMEAHDAQLVSAGITTVLDSVCIGESVDQGRQVLLDLSLRALEDASDSLRADHRLHLRCEIGDPLMGDLFERVCGHPLVGMVSLMDHTPGQRQWRDLESYRTYYETKKPLAEIRAETEEIARRRDRVAGGHVRKVSEFAAARRVPLASHDDTLPEDVDQALCLGASISEFPTTLEAAKKASALGLAVTMGAPNLVRGGSHSGNVRASMVASEGLLSSLSSDYVPSSLLLGAFILNRDCGLTFEESMRTVTETPARLGRMDDRGRLEPGLRADLVRVRVRNSRPVVRSVWVAGRQVF
ncbi:MAG: alpha-D-ribose 1-methylphosphonate 5-triphosphate diphosphatase [Deltaproteobacteria bacterium]|jgi:alpha-D-ribose 1-methylphosphonate 5-triphosphate diphosphatase|nr:alpha-D-ribose 1-methylphosphonate 5-triphosphate diphosphatase [Deltaproteobacteria bacterium]